MSAREALLRPLRPSWPLGWRSARKECARMQARLMDRGIQEGTLLTWLVSRGAPEAMGPFALVPSFAPNPFHEFHLKARWDTIAAREWEQGMEVCFRGRGRQQVVHGRLLRPGLARLGEQFCELGTPESLEALPMELREVLSGLTRRKDPWEAYWPQFNGQSARPWKSPEAATARWAELDADAQEVAAALCTEWAGTLDELLRAASHAARVS